VGTTVWVVVRPYWLSSWFLRVFAVPFVLVDGTEYRANWSRPLHLAVPPGQQLIGAGIRYPGMRRLLGYRPTTVNALPDVEMQILAQNGLLNSEPFYLRVLP
jgi:hypothetical protein